jgi:ThiC-associated domain
MHTKSGARKNGEARAVVSQTESADGATRSNQLPNSRKVYVSGKIHPDIRVPFREISLAPTKSMNGETEINEPVRVYDTSGPWGDSDFHGDVTQGLPPLRSKWIRARGDVEEYDGRKVQPIDDGYLSESHAAHAGRKRPTSNAQRPTSKSESGNGVGSNSVFDVRRSAFGVLLFMFMLLDWSEARRNAASKR